MRHIIARKVVQVVEKKRQRLFCDGCGAELLNHAGKPDFALDDFQVDGGLVIELKGGYGMYFDPIDGRGVRRIVLCQQCADTLCKAVPYFNSIIRNGETVEFKFNTDSK